MTFSNEIINETIEFIKNLKLKDEKEIIEELTSKDFTITEENVLKWLQTPLIKELYKDKELMTIALNKMLKIGFHRFIPNISELIDINMVLNQQFVIDFLLDSNNTKDFSGFDTFFEFYDGEILDKFVEKFKDARGNVDLYFLRDIPDQYIDKEIDSMSDQEKRKIVMDYVDYYGRSNPYLEKKIWEIGKDLLKDFSIHDKLNFFDHITDIELKKEIFKELNFKDNLDIIINDYKIKKIILDYISEEEIFELFKSAVNEDKILKYYSILPSNLQINAIRHLVAIKSSIRFSRILLESKKETKKILFDTGKIKFSTREILELYKEFHDKSYLKILKENLLKEDSLLSNEIELLYDNDFVSILSDEEKKLFANKITDSCFSMITLPKEDNIDTYFFSIYKEKLLDYAKRNPNKQFFITVREIIKSFTIDEQIEILKHQDLKDIVDYACRNSNEGDFDKIILLLELDKDLLNKSIHKDKTPLSLTYLGKPDEKKIDNLLKLIDYLDDDSLYICFNPYILEKNDIIRDIFLKKINENPNIINDYKLLNFLDENKRNEVLKNINFKNIYNMYYEYLNNEKDKSDNLLLSAIYDRFDDLLKFESYYDEYMFKIIKSFDYEHQLKYITKTNEIRLLNLIIAEGNNNEFIDLAIDKVIKIFKDEALQSFHVDYYDILSKKISFSNFDNKTNELIFSRMDLTTKLLSYYKYSDPVFRKKILDEIKNNFDLLLDSDVISIIGDFFNMIDNEDKEYFYKLIEDKINTNNFYINNKDKIKEIDIIDKLNIIFLDKCGAFIGNNYDLTCSLLDNNPFLFKTASNILFNDDIKKMNMHFIEKVSKYKKVQQQLKKIEADKDKMNILILASKFIPENNLVTYDREIEIIISFLANYDKEKTDYDLSNIDDNNINSFIQYMINNCNGNVFDMKVKNISGKLYHSIDEDYKFTPDNYIEKRGQKCDEVFSTCTEIDEMKNIYFNKYFSMTLTDIQDFMKKYIANYSRVQNYVDESNRKSTLLFIELINKIMSISDPITLREQYLKNDIYYSTTDIFNIEAIMSQAYFDSLAHDYHDKQNGTQVTKMIKDKDGNITLVEMTELLDNFGILVHSTCAYGEMPLIDDNYHTSWNYNPNTENHGICCSYISNSSYGTADVTGTGVMFGFTRLTKDSIATFAPYDLVTSNNGFTIDSRFTPFFTTLDQVSDYTRHTHNEFDLERRLPDGDNFCVQPDCIIIFEDMDESIKANSLKAYQDFKKHGIELKLIYIDRVKVANMEADKISKMITEYRETNNLDLLKEIINKYESNICGCDFLAVGKNKSKNLFNMDELFMTNDITKLIYETVQRLVTSNDIEGFNKFVSILDNEQYKFDLLHDDNVDRRHTFKLYSDELKEMIAHAKQSLNIEVKGNTK